MTDHQECSGPIHPQGQPPIFVLTMVPVERREGFRIKKHCGGTLKSDLMIL